MKTFKCIILVFVLLSFSGCINTDDEFSNSIKANSLDEVIQNGLEVEQISGESILHIEDINEEKIIFFTKDDALGIAVVASKDENWYWKRTSAYADFQTDDPKWYMAGGTTVKTLNDKEYFVAMGKIFNSDIERLTLNNDSIEAVIKKYGENVFWFSVLNGESSFKDIRVYNNRNELIEYETSINTPLKVERTVIDVPYTPTEVTPSVAPYEVLSDMSNIKNLNQFPALSQRQKNLLLSNGFFVNPSTKEQLFYIYEDNEYKEIPTFVTTDSVLQVYHIFYDYSLRVLETEKLLGILEELNDDLLKKMIILNGKTDNKNVKEASLKNIAFLGTAQLTLNNELPVDMPEKAKTLAYSEYEKITSERGFEKSSIFDFQLDYSQYRPRGHYTNSDELKNYFRTMMWYGQVPMPLYKKSPSEEIIRDVDSTLQAMLLTHATFMNNETDNDVTKWESIYDPTLFYVGAADDLDIYDYKEILDQVYGNDLNLDTMDDDDKINAFYAEADLLPEPKIKPKYTAVNTPVGKQFRIMGQRFVPDSEIMQNLVEPYKRPIPKGLDVMAVLGSKRAEQLLLEHYKEQEKWENYQEELEKMKTQYSSLDTKVWQSNMYYGWLWTLKGLLRPYDAGYPSFMTNSAWEDKSLSTALGSWSELKHDTVLYGKQSGAECGGGEQPPEIKGYVEPNVEVYEKLLWLNRFSRANLKERDLITGEIESKLEQFEDLLTFLIDCSVKELNNEPLTKEENYQLLTYGGQLEYLTASFAGDGMRWYEITSETDKNMAVISDIYTLAPTSYLEVGVGPAHEIYVVVPIEGELHLTRGAVFSYYEFIHGDKRLTDEEWQQMIKEGNTPTQSDWIKDYMGGNENFEIPEPSKTD
jgi:hypothetical protein